MELLLVGRIAARSWSHRGVNRWELKRISSGGLTAGMRRQGGHSLERQQRGGRNPEQGEDEGLKRANRRTGARDAPKSLPQSLQQLVPAR